MRHPSAARIGAVLAILVAARPAAADQQPSAAELASARSLFNEARQAEEQGNWGDALEKLDAVAKVKMTPQVRFHLGLCQEHTTRLVEALNNLERAAAEGAEQNLPTVVEEAKGHAADVRARLPKLFIALPPGRTDARVEVDGHVVATVLLSRPVPFDPGAHKIVVTAPGLVFSHELSIAEREEKRIDVVFAPAPTSASPSPFPAAPTEATPPPRPPSPSPDPDSGGFFRSPTTGWVAVGVGSAALVGASISILVRQDAINDIETECSTHQNCPRHLESSQSTARTFGALGIALGLLGGASVVTGVVVLTQSRREPAPANVGVAPWMTATGGGATGVLSW